MKEVATRFYGYIRTLNPLKVSFELISHGEGQQKSKTLSNSYSTVVGIYGSKPTEPEGAARGQGGFTKFTQLHVVMS